MEKYALIFDVVRQSPTEFKSHYRLYDINRDLIAESDYVYTIKKMRKMTPGALKAKITTGIKTHEIGKKHVKRGCTIMTSCLVSNKVLAVELKDMKPLVTEAKKVVEKVTTRVEVEDNPRIFKVVLINGNYTIVKSESKYLTREQAKEELFVKQLEEA